MRCVTSVSGELFEVEANTADVLHHSPAEKLNEEESLQELHLLLREVKNTMLLHNFTLSWLLVT